MLAVLAQNPSILAGEQKFCIIKLPIVLWPHNTKMGQKDKYLAQNDQNANFGPHLALCGDEGQILTQCQNWSLTKMGPKWHFLAKKMIVCLLI